MKLTRVGAALLAAALAAPLPALAQGNAALAALVQQGRHWQAQQRPDLALRSFERALLADPQSPEALAGAAEAQAALGNRPAAEALLARLRAVSPGTPAVAAAQEALRGSQVERSAIEDARRLAREGRVPEALTRYRDAFDGNRPPDAYAAEYWLTLAGTSGGWEEARRELAALAARRPQDSRARVAAAQVLTWREPTRAEGIAMLAQLARDPATGPQAVQAWRQALLWLGTGPSAEAPLEALLPVRPADAPPPRRSPPPAPAPGGCGPGRGAPRMPPPAHARTASIGCRRTASPRRRAPSRPPLPPIRTMPMRWAASAWCACARAARPRRATC